VNPAMREYYEARSREYDDWWLGTGLFAARERPGWDEDVAELCGALAALAPARTLDLACGTGFLTLHLRGEVTGLDQSAGMLRVAGERCPGVEFVRGDALDPPFEPESFERVVSGHFYGHLDEAQRERFVTLAHSLAPELVVVDSALRSDTPEESWEERLLKDGSTHAVYKRRFTAEGLARELGGGEVVHAGPYFVAVRSSSPPS
jgi:SAM-dependent methyltransferase